MSEEKNTGIPFEKKISGIYKQILALDGPELKNLRVENNVKLDSITARKNNDSPQKRQIDVYWEFELAGIIFRVCIQAKDWKNKIKLEQVDAFRSVLDDIAGHPKGIMIASNGYQSGALGYARARGIELLVLEPIEAGSKRSISASFARYNTTPTNFQVHPDNDWNIAAGLERAGTITVPGTVALPLYMGDRTPWGTLWDAINGAIPRANKIGIFSGEFVFNIPTFIHTGNEVLPRYKLWKVLAEGELSYFIQPVKVRRAVTQVLRSVLSDQKYLVDDFGKLVQETEPLEASRDVVFPHGHTMKLTVVNIGHLSDEEKKKYQESMQRLSEDQ